MMKRTLLLTGVAALVLSACAAPIRVGVVDGKSNELKSIQKICIIPNAKRTPQGYERVIANSLQKFGIQSEIVDVSTNRQRLYEPECRYNLRYVSAGNQQAVSKVTMILRTPDYAMSTVGYNINGEPQYKTNPDLQKQTDGIVARLLNR